MSAAEPCPPGTGFLDAETGPSISPPETTYARRDQRDLDPLAQIPAQTAYLSSMGKYPVRGDWVRGITNEQYQLFTLRYGNFRPFEAKKPFSALPSPKTKAAPKHQAVVSAGIFLAHAVAEYRAE